jgi:hypothetical protein
MQMLLSSLRTNILTYIEEILAQASSDLPVKILAQGFQLRQAPQCVIINILQGLVQSYLTKELS